MQPIKLESATDMSHHSPFLQEGVYETEYYRALRESEEACTAWWSKLAANKHAETKDGFDRVSWSWPQDIPQSLAPRENCRLADVSTQESISAAYPHFHLPRQDDREHRGHTAHTPHAYTRVLYINRSRMPSASSIQTPPHFILSHQFKKIYFVLTHQFLAHPPIREILSYL